MRLLLITGIFSCIFGSFFIYSGFWQVFINPGHLAYVLPTSVGYVLFGVIALLIGVFLLLFENFKKK